MIVINCATVVADGPMLKTKTRFARYQRKREVNCNRSLPRECQRGGNGMYDQRVLRGSNFAPVRPPKEPPITSPALQRKLCEAQQRLELRKITNVAQNEGRRSYPLVQCAADVSQEQEKRTIAMQHNTDQTDLTPGYLRLLRDINDEVVKCKTGYDQWTQVTEDDLTTFEVESYPLMELLTAGALEQAAICVLYEDDMVMERLEQADYESKQLAERVELERLEQQEAMARRCGLRAIAKAERAEPGPTFRAIHGRAMASEYMANLLNHVLDQLVLTEYLHNENDFISWFHDRLPGYCQHHTNNDDKMNALIDDVITNRSRVSRDAVNVFWDDKKRIHWNRGQIPCTLDPQFEVMVKTRVGRTGNDPSSAIKSNVFTE